MGNKSLLAAILLFTSCETHSGGASEHLQDVARSDATLKPAQILKLPNGITLAEESLKEDVLQILTQRGGKDPKDLWQVDRHGRTVRIKKSRTDGAIYPPGASVEFWRKDGNGHWRQLPTA